MANFPVGFHSGVITLFITFDLMLALMMLVVFVRLTYF